MRASLRCSQHGMAHLPQSLVHPDDLDQLHTNKSHRLAACKESLQHGTVVHLKLISVPWLRSCAVKTGSCSWAVSWKSYMHVLREQVSAHIDMRDTLLYQERRGRASKCPRRNDDISAAYVEAGKHSFVSTLLLVPAQLALQLQT